MSKVNEVVRELVATTAREDSRAHLFAKLDGHEIADDGSISTTNGHRVVYDLAGAPTIYDDAGKVISSYDDAGALVIADEPTPATGAAADAAPPELSNNDAEVEALRRELAEARTTIERQSEVLEQVTNRAQPADDADPENPGSDPDVTSREGDSPA